MAEFIIFVQALVIILFVAVAYFSILSLYENRTNYKVYRIKHSDIWYQYEEENGERFWSSDFSLPFPIVMVETY